MYGSEEAHRIRQIAIALSTAASGVAIWAFALSWQHNGSYASALLGAALLALLLAAVDCAALAKPELIESIVRRAPTWEQKLAFRQRMGYNSHVRSVKRLAALAAARAGVLPNGAAATGGTRTTSTASSATWGEADEEAVRQTWVDATIEPVHQANPIFPAAREP